MINKLLSVVIVFSLVMVTFVSWVAWDSYSCEFEITFPKSNSFAMCEGGVYLSKTRLEKGKERYKIDTKALYIKLFDRILLVPVEMDIDVEMKGSLAVYDAEKIKTPNRTFGEQPYTSMTLLTSPEGALKGVVVFSDPNSVFVPATRVTGTF